MLAGIPWVFKQRLHSEQGVQLVGHVFVGSYIVSECGAAPERCNIYLLRVLNNSIANR